MNIVSRIEAVNGQLKRTETITWPSGRVTKRIYNRPNDTMAEAIVELKPGRAGVIPFHKPDVAVTPATKA